MNAPLRRQVETPASARVGVLADPRGPDADAFRAKLGSAAKEAQWFAPRDADDLAREVDSGALQDLYFKDLRSLLDGVLEGVYNLRRWRAQGVRIEFLQPPESAADERRAAALDAILSGLSEAAREWHQVRRRRRATAGVLLGIVAVLAAAAVTLIPLAMR